MLPALTTISPLLARYANCTDFGAADPRAGDDPALQRLAYDRTAKNDGDARSSNAFQEEQNVGGARRCPIGWSERTSRRFP